MYLSRHSDIQTSWLTVHEDRHGPACHSSYMGISGLVSCNTDGGSMHDCRGAMQYSITVSLAFEEASSHSAEAICPCDISGILLPLLRCLHSSPSILRICHYSGLDTEHSIRTLTEQWRTRTPGMSAGCWPIASRSWVCMISSLSQVCSQSWYSFLSSVMANKKQATTI